MGLSDNVKNGLLSFGSQSVLPNNSPKQYGDRRLRYLDRQTREFATQTARYSADYMSGTAQGLFGDPDEITKIRFRMADVVNPSAAIQRNFDDYKTLLIAEPRVDYLPPGVKISSMGSDWLLTNAANLSNPVGNGVLRRCNTVWRSLDFYGRWVNEPIIVHNKRAEASDSNTQDSGDITKGYFNIVAQYNSVTKQLNTNSRIMLGTAAYVVTGYSNFLQEFTGDQSTVHLIEFTLRYDEPNEALDDLERCIADAKSFSWEISVDAPEQMRFGSTAQLLAASRRNGEIVLSTEKHPISYSFKSSDPNIVSVDENGILTAGNTAGSATVTVTLRQNPAISAQFSVAVTEPGTERVEFTSPLPSVLKAFEKAEISAAYCNPSETAEPISWSFSGAADGSFSTVVTGNTVEISCWSGSIAPLLVTAEHGGKSSHTEILLEGL